MYPDGTYFQDFGLSNGEIAESIVKPLKMDESTKSLPSTSINWLMEE